MNFLSVDHIEEGFAVCEDKNQNVKIIAIKNSAPELKEGSIIYLNSNGQIIVDEGKTQERKQIIIDLKNKISKNG